MNNLLLTGAFKYDKKQILLLENLGYNIRFIKNERVGLKINVSNINTIVCNNLFLFNDIKEFDNLSCIQLTSAGLDRVPIDYIDKNNIKLYSAKDVYSIPMAEWAILKILEIYKMSKFFYKNQEKHIWKKNREVLELTGKTALIIGFGSVGSEIAKRLKPFGLKVLSLNRSTISNQYVDESLVLNDIDSALEKADIIILTLPLNNNTKHLINDSRIRKMKKTAVLINISRGEIVDECALTKAIEEGKFLGVALDVFEKEPLEKSPLWDNEKIIITPHNSFISEQVNDRLFELMMNNLSENILQ